MSLSKVDLYFLTRDAPIGKYRRLDLKKIRNWLIGLAGLAVIGLLFTGNGEQESPPAATSIDNHTAIPQGATANGFERSSNGGFYLSSLSGLSLGEPGRDFRPPSLREVRRYFVTKSFSYSVGVLNPIEV